MNQISKQRNGDLASPYKRSEAHMRTERNMLLDGPGRARVNTVPTAETDAEIVRHAHMYPFLYSPRTNELDTSTGKHTLLFQGVADNVKPRDECGIFTITNWE